MWTEFQKNVSDESTCDEVIAAADITVDERLEALAAVYATAFGSVIVDGTVRFGKLICTVKGPFVCLFAVLRIEAGHHLFRRRSGFGFANLDEGESEIKHNDDTGKKAYTSGVSILPEPPCFLV